MVCSGMLRCFSWSCRPRRVDTGCSPCCSPSSYAAQSSLRGGAPSSSARKFALAELSAATDGFRASNLIGEGGFGRVYRGRLVAEDVEVAVKQLCRGGAQGSREFLVECTMLMTLRHPNLVSLVGYCADAQERLLVYEYLRGGSLDAHLFGGGGGLVLDWNARVRIALGAARGLRYLHEVVSPPVIYRDLKPSNILLGGPDLRSPNPKLSDLGLARLGPDPDGDDTHVTTRVMGTYGYCAPEYAATGHLSVRSDVYSFGVVLLELLTGRRAFDAAAETEEDRRLLAWARPYLSRLQRRQQGTLSLGGMADPALRGRYPRRALYQAAVIASLCLRDKPNLRPTMGDVTQALEHVASQPWVEVESSSQQPEDGGPCRRGGAGTPPPRSCSSSWDVGGHRQQQRV